MFFSEFGVATIVASNLTKLAQQASDADLERAIRHGIGRDGRALFIMPAEMYRVLTDEDLARVIAWVRSVPEAVDSLPARTIGPLGHFGILTEEFYPSRHYIETGDHPAAAGESGVASGHYVAWSSCTECHGGTLGGDGVTTPALGPMANAYSAEEFVAFLRTGIAKGGRELPMMSGVARGRSSTCVRRRWSRCTRICESCATDANRFAYSRCAAQNGERDATVLSYPAPRCERICDCATHLRLSWTMVESEEVRGPSDGGERDGIAGRTSTRHKSSTSSKAQYSSLVPCRSSVGGCPAATRSIGEKSAGSPTSRTILRK